MTNVEKLNNLIFDTETNMLMSICCNLVYEPTDPFCQKNASIVMEYFSVHGKMQDLFAWAFTKEYLEKKNVNDETATYKFFTAFNFLYAIDNMFDFSKEVVKPLFDDTSLMDSIDVELFKGNPDEFTKEMNDKYYKNVQDLLKIMQILKNGFEVYLRLVPANYFSMLNGINKILQEPVYKSRGFTSNMFGKIIKMTVCNFMKNRRMLRRAYTNWESYQQKIGFVADTLQKLLNKSNEPYIMHLNAIAKNLDEFYSINTMLETTTDTPQQQNEELCALSTNEMASLIKCNILPIKRMLSPMVRIELASALSLKACASDDFMIYQDVLRSFETFAREYYTYFNAVYSEIDGKTRQLVIAKERYDAANAEYKEKKEKNAKLREQLIELRKKHGIQEPLSDALMGKSESTTDWTKTNDANRKSLVEQLKVSVNKKDEKKKKEEQKKLEKEQKKKKKEEEKKRKEEEKKKGAK